MKKSILIAVIIIILIGIGGYFWSQQISSKDDGGVQNTGITTDDSQQQTDEQVGIGEGDWPITIGTSVEGRDIDAYTFGSGDTELLFVGGIHGGYSWNTALVAYDMIDYLQANPSVIPSNVSVTVIPVLNPDGLYKTVGTDGRFAQASVTLSLKDSIPGRFNAHTVDLNRNFDCDWQQNATWQNTTVSGGSHAFSEPESQALRNYVGEHKPTAVLAWYSSAGGVFASSCHNGVSEETTALTNLYAKASGYPAYRDFDFYAITGDMVNWFAKNNVPAISVLLSTHDDVEWNKNKAGIDAFLQHYAK